MYYTIRVAFLSFFFFRFLDRVVCRWLIMFGLLSEAGGERGVFFGVQYKVRNVIRGNNRNGDMQGNMAYGQQP